VLTEFYGEEEYSKKLFQVGALEELREKSIEIIVTRLERFFRAIARQFVFGDFSSDAYIFVGEVGVFSDIKDENLGKTDYRKYRNGENIKR
jgi:hypothetical protein